MPYFCQNLVKMAHNLSSDAVVIGALRVKGNISFLAKANHILQSKRSSFYEKGRNW